MPQNQYRIALLNSMSTLVAKWTTRLKHFVDQVRPRTSIALRILYYGYAEPNDPIGMTATKASTGSPRLKLLDECEYNRLYEISRTVEQLSQELSTARQAAASRQLSNLNSLADCDRFVSCIIQSLSTVRGASEQAVLSIQQHVSTLFNIARDDNALSTNVLNRALGAKHSDPLKPDEPLAEIVKRQEGCVTDFIRETRSFFDRQYELTRDVHDACLDMKQCISRINQLVFSSELLAFNVRVEALRLGDHGSPFAVLSEELVKFSQSIKAINLDIQRSLTEVSQRIGLCHDQTSTMKSSLNTFADDLTQQVAEVQARTHELTESLSSTLSHISQSNQVLMTSSQAALSALQFHEPLTHNIKQAANEVYKLKMLFENGFCNDSSVPDLATNRANRSGNNAQASKPGL